MAEAHGSELFESWIKRSGLTRDDVAKRLNVSRVAIWSWISRKSSPLEPVRNDIETLTEGDVPGSSWGKSLDRRRREVAS